MFGMNAFYFPNQKEKARFPPCKYLKDPLLSSKKPQLFIAENSRRPTHSSIRSIRVQAEVQELAPQGKILFSY